MNRARGRRLFLVGVGLLVVGLVGGRWLALETAERAWAETLPGGEMHLVARDLARFVSGLFLFLAIAWGTSNLLFVYRAIESVKLPRRLGNLEIVEAVPRRLLLASTIASGLVYGLLLALGTGEWWMQAAIAAKPPRFGLTDPVLHRDVGYYVAYLPWAERVRGFVVAATVSALVIVGLLYLGMESLRFRRGVPYASAHARSHLGVLLAALGLTLTWGALLDPAETVGGLHGALTRGVLTVRLPGAPVLVGLGVIATLASLVWVVRERPALLTGSWGALVAASLLVYVVLPGVLDGAAPRGGRRTPADPALAAAARRFEGLAFGVDTAAARAPPGFASPAAALLALPRWDRSRVAATVAQRRDLLGPNAAAGPPALLAPRGMLERAIWLVAPRPDLDSLLRAQPLPEWRDIHRGARAHVGRPVAAWEGASGLEFAPVVTRDSASWFGPGFREFAVVAPDSVPRLQAGLLLGTGWRRLALAWALQSAELARSKTDGLVLLWRRDVRERLEQLAPFASFDEPAPALADSALWWITYGYLASPTFPLARPVPGDAAAGHYLRAGFVGVVSAASGDTRLYVAPGADALAGAWAQLLAPLILPADSLPASLRSQLPYPRRSFPIATALVAEWRSDSVPWVARPHDPFELVGPAREATAREPAAAQLWMATGYEAGDPPTFAALVAGAMSATGPQLVVWRPPAAARPVALVGSPNETAPGMLRLWNAADRLFSVQALFSQPATGGAPSGIDTLFLTWGDRRGQGPTAAAALRDLVAPGGGGSAGARTDTTLAARWDAARALAAQADAALAAGNLEAFGRYYAQLKEVLGLGRRKLAPGPARR